MSSQDSDPDGDKLFDWALGNPLTAIQEILKKKKQLEQKQIVKQKQIAEQQHIAHERTESQSKKNSKKHLKKSVKENDKLDEIEDNVQKNENPNMPYIAFLHVVGNESPGSEGNADSEDSDDIDADEKFNTFKDGNNAMKLNNTELNKTDLHKNMSNYLLKNSSYSYNGGLLIENKVFDKQHEPGKRACHFGGHDVERFVSFDKDDFQTFNSTAGEYYNKKTKAFLFDNQQKLKLKLNELNYWSEIKKNGKLRDYNVSKGTGRIQWDNWLHRWIPKVFIDVLLKEESIKFTLNKVSSECSNSNSDDSNSDDSSDDSDFMQNKLAFLKKNFNISDSDSSSGDSETEFEGLAQFRLDRIARQQRNKKRKQLNSIAKYVTKRNKDKVITSIKLKKLKTKLTWLCNGNNVTRKDIESTPDLTKGLVKMTTHTNKKAKKWCIKLCLLFDIPTNFLNCKLRF